MISKRYDVIVIGAGAAGLMCAASAGSRGRSVLVVDMGKRPGRKILISGGGRCNFTNYNVEAHNYLSNNPHFVKSALSQYTNWDFISLVSKYGVPYHERDHGQLFCDDSAKQIVDLLLSECRLSGNVDFCYQTEISEIEKASDGSYLLQTPQSLYQSVSLVIATGGLSMPRLGATPFAWKVAEHFEMNVIPPRAALVPFTLDSADKALCDLTGTALPVSISSNDQTFTEALLFTHRGLSGPSVLQISSYWKPGQAVTIDWLPSFDLAKNLKEAVSSGSAQELKTFLGKLLPKRLVEILLDQSCINSRPLRQLNPKQVQSIAKALHSWVIKPGGTEGYRTAEVTLGGVDTNNLSSKTMESKDHKGLFFIGECMDVTGHLGGYNFQWAWSSGWVAGQNA